MKKLFCLAWLLLFPFMKEVRFELENKEHYASQLQTMILSSKTAFEGSIFLDDELYKEIKKEDWKMDTLTFDPLEFGIYTLYDVEGEMVDQIIFEDDQFHIAFSQKPAYKKDEMYLFQNYPQTFVLSPKEETNYQGIRQNQSYYYELNQTNFQFLNVNYCLLVDEHAPIMLNEIICYTNQPCFDLVLQDESFEWFDVGENGIYTCHISLQEGRNDLSIYTKDLAGNPAFESYEIIYDRKAPSIDVRDQKIYLSSSKGFMIDEEYFDASQSYVKVNEEKKSIEQQTVYLDQSGKYEIYLVDFANNSSTYFIEVVMDTEKPTVTYIIDHQQLLLTPSEPLLMEEYHLFLNQEEIALDTVLEEGMYQLEAHLKDCAGNESLIQETICVDESAPKIFCPIETTVLHQFRQILITIEDQFLEEWRVEVYRNQQLLNTYQGNQSTTFYVDLKEDACTVYTIEVYAKDLHQAVEFEKKIIMDSYCAAIELSIDGINANQVERLTLTKETIFDFSCLESEITWQLYYQNGECKEGKGHQLVLHPNENLKSLQLKAEDAYGFTQEKTIEFVYENTLFEEMTMEPPMEEEVSVEEENKSHPWMMIGGGFLAIIALSGWIFTKIRSQQSDKDLSQEEDISLRNQENTTRILSPFDR